MAKLNSGAAAVIAITCALALTPGCGDDDDDEDDIAMSGGTAGTSSNEGGAPRGGRPARGGAVARGGSTGTGNSSGIIAGAAGESGMAGGGGAGGDGAGAGGDGGIGGVSMAGAGGEFAGGAGGSEGTGNSVSAECTRCLTEKCAETAAFETTQCAAGGCDSLRACYGGSTCDEVDPRSCYCGTVEFTDCFSSFVATVPNGPCKAQIVAALVPQHAPVDIPQVLAPFVLETTNPVGAVNQRAICQTRECDLVCGP